MQRNYYSTEKLIQMARFRGYYTIESIAVGLSQNTGSSVSSWKNKLGSGHLSREEMLVVAAYFEMTPKEFCDIFFHGLFFENELGHFVAAVDSLTDVIGKPKVKKTQREEKRDEILAKIEQI